MTHNVARSASSLLSRRRKRLMRRLMRTKWCWDTWGGNRRMWSDYRIIGKCQRGRRWTLLSDSESAAGSECSDWYFNTVTVKKHTHTHTHTHTLTHTHTHTHTHTLLFLICSLFSLSLNEKSEDPQSYYSSSWGSSLSCIELRCSVCIQGLFLIIHNIVLVY